MEIESIEYNLIEGDWTNNIIKLLLLFIIIYHYY